MIAPSHEAWPTWGTLQPERLESRRRTRTLGLGAATRAYNEAAVPGIGNLWYGKQLLYAALGIQFAEDTSKRNIPVANAIEALACMLALQDVGTDPRLRGRRKLSGRSLDTPFKTVSRRSFYVVQPMRLGMAQPLLELGFASAEGGSARFNALRLTERGEEFTTAALLGFRPFNRTVEDHLLRWVAGAAGTKNDTDPLKRALSPIEPLPKGAVEILRERLVSGGQGATRRSAAMDWVRQESHSGDWGQRPAVLDAAHWHALREGASFFDLRDASLACLDEIERGMAGSSDHRRGLSALVGSLENHLRNTLEKARCLLENIEKRPEGAAVVGAGDGEYFARRLANCHDDVERVRVLVERDGRVLRLTGDEVSRGPAFNPDSRSSTEAGEKSDDSVGRGSRASGFPTGISTRIYNLSRLCRDLDGKLKDWLDREQKQTAGGSP